MTTFKNKAATSLLMDVTLDEATVLHSVILNLYEEGVEPSRVEILYKLRELDVRPELLTYVPAYYLNNKQWYIVTEKESNFTVKLVNEPDWFAGWVKLKSPLNEYSPDTWIAFVDYIAAEITRYAAIPTDNNGVKSSNHLFSHTRYGLARYIHSNGPLILRQLRLGEIAHLVQLAIHHEILRYEKTIIVPNALTYNALLVNQNFRFQNVAQYFEYMSLLSPLLYEKYNLVDFNKKSCNRSSESIVSTAASNSANVCQSMNTVNYESMQDEREQSLRKLEVIIKKLLKQNDRILMSQVRLLIQNKYNFSINPLDYGYNKLSDLLIEEFRDTCCLIRHRNRHVYLGSAKENKNVEEQSLQKKGFAIYTIAKQLQHYQSDMYRSGLGRSIDGTEHMTFERIRKNAVDWDLNSIIELENKHNALKSLFYK